MTRYVRYIQPIGFALLLAHFILITLDVNMVFFWAGVTCTVVGTSTEIYAFLKTPAARRTQVGWVFTMGIFSKLMLIAAIVLRVYDFPRSIYILLGCILLSFVWFFLSQIVKPEKHGNKEFLDVE